MPSDPVYNPHLPSPVWKPSSSVLESDLSATSELSLTGTGSSSWSAMSAGLVVGAVAGAALALMFTPRPGSELRNSIRFYTSGRGERLARSIRKRRMSGSPSEPEWRSSDATGSGPQPLTASVAEISGIDRRFEEPLGG